ncbi:hypothetical protein TPB0596_37650 [Tsukamurella pulmonis]|nr:hypothetical protein [Tsukamurella pulmonis]BDD84002.1 hypothetical protein TPB0596_37650 [Tsukamurella pulmonis]
MTARLRPGLVDADRVLLGDLDPLEVAQERAGLAIGLVGLQGPDVLDPGR